MAERKQPIEDWLVAIDLQRQCRTDGTSRETGHNRVQRFPAGGYPIGFGGYSGVTHRVGPTLLRTLSTAQIINPVAGRPPLSA